MKTISIVSVDKSGVLSDVLGLMDKHDVHVDVIQAEVLGRVGVIKISVEPYPIAVRVLQSAHYDGVLDNDLFVRGASKGPLDKMEMFMRLPISLKEEDGKRSIVCDFNMN